MLTSESLQKRITKECEETGIDITSLDTSLTHYSRTIQQWIDINIDTQNSKIDKLLQSIGKINEKVNQHMAAFLNELCQGTSSSSSLITSEQEKECLKQALGHIGSYYQVMKCSYLCHITYFL
ncbi:hypothetical protein I4U23_026672 [Adineta vaga]|nr:hypothetical protein I4U23_026672 [Adineta vaga]